MKRFYKSADAAASEGHDGHTVRLDGRPVRTPGKAALTLPTVALAEAIAAEWRAQGDKIVPDTMPLMSLAATAIDRVVDNHAVVAAEAAGYAGTDLLCYRAETPIELAQRQAEAWDPVLDWARSNFDARFEVTLGLMPIEQPAKTLARFQDVMATREPFELTALHVMTTAFGSLLLALSVDAGATTAARALDASRVDEVYQAELWGEEEEAAKRRDRLLREVESAERFLGLLRDSA